MANELKDKLKNTMVMVLNERNLFDERPMPLRVWILLEDGTWGEEVTFSAHPKSFEVIKGVAYILQPQLMMMFGEVWQGPTDDREAMMGAIIFPSGKANVYLVPIKKKGALLLESFPGLAECQQTQIQDIIPEMNGWGE